MRVELLIEEHFRVKLLRVKLLRVASSKLLFEMSTLTVKVIF